MNLASNVQVVGNMKVFLIGLCVVLWAGLAESGTFSIDYANNTFIRDGQPFQYVSGSAHYFRMPRPYWRDRLRKMKAAGLNAVSTYVEWSQHEPRPGQYIFDGDLDLEAYIKTAQDEGLLVILRPGPYICAERDLGGFPYWLLTKYPDIRLRTNDSRYLTEVDRWLKVLMPRIVPYLYGNGGPIIMVQVENEYGSYFACDFDYLNWLAAQFQSYVHHKAVLFTTDGAGKSYLRCGKINGVYATIDFGTEKFDINKTFIAMREYESQGPLVNSEYYTGWLTHWGEPNANVAPEKVAKTLDSLLAHKVNVNFYMFFGGTNFGFTAGANGLPYISDITSYDYDAPLSEAGDMTAKYDLIKQTISKYFPVPNVTVANSIKASYGKFQLQATAGIFHPNIRKILGIKHKSKYPETFEAVDQNYGYLLYETKLKSEGISLLATQVHDYANIFVNNIQNGTLSRETNTSTITINATGVENLGIFVENLGRINYGSYLNDFKGIVQNVTLNNEVVDNWSMTSFRLDNLTDIEFCYHDVSACLYDHLVNNGYIFYMTKVVLTKDIADTFIDVSNLKKGLVFVNNINLGRYWSDRGPQLSLYIPGVYLKPAPEENIFIILDEYVKKRNIEVKLVSEHVIQSKEVIKV